MKTIQFLSFIKQSLNEDMIKGHETTFIKQSLGCGKKTKYCFEEHIYHGKLQL